MDPKFAKELKDAGFPSLQGFKDHELNDENYGAENRPHLEELIQECEPQFTKLIHQKKGGRWFSEARAYADKKGAQATGSTAVEAVARLWIELHKK